MHIGIQLKTKEPIILDYTRVTAVGSDKRIMRNLIRRLLLNEQSISTTLTFLAALVLHNAANLSYKIHNMIWREEVVYEHHIRPIERK